MPVDSAGISKFVSGGERIYHAIYDEFEAKIGYCFARTMDPPAGCFILRAGGLRGDCRTQRVCGIIHLKARFEAVPPIATFWAVPKLGATNGVETAKASADRFFSTRPAI